MAAITNNLLYVPPKEAVEWCSEQHLIHENNQQWAAIGMIVVAYLLLSAYSFLNHFERTKKYAYIPVQFSRLIILLYFALSILVLKYRLLWVG